MRDEWCIDILGHNTVESMLLGNYKYSLMNLLDLKPC